MRHGLLVLAGILLVACAQEENATIGTPSLEDDTVIEHIYDDGDQHSHDHAHNNDHAHDHDHSHDNPYGDAALAYHCHGSQGSHADIFVNSQADAIQMLYQGVEYDLQRAAATTGERYVSQIGLSANQGLSWQVMGDQATLSATTDDTNTDLETLYECEQTTIEELEHHTH